MVVRVAQVHLGDASTERQPVEHLAGPRAALRAADAASGQCVIPALASLATLAHDQATLLDDAASRFLASATRSERSASDTIVDGYALAALDAAVARRRVRSRRRPD